MLDTCNTTWQRTQSVEADDPPPPTSKKYKIIVDVDGAKVRDATKWSSRSGALIRSHIPIGYEEWRKVDKFYKDNLWIDLLKEFEMNIDPNLARPILEEKFSQYFRTMKAMFRNKYLKQDGELIPRRVAIDNRPNDIDKMWWEKFIEIEYSDRKRKQCKINAENKAKCTINHTLGRRSYNKVYEDLGKKNPDEKVMRAIAWKVAHISKKTGEVLPCTAEKFALIEEVEERQKLESSVNGDDGIKSLEYFEKDPIAEVFGDDNRRNYCRAISSTASVKQVKLKQASKAIVDFKENEDRQWKTENQNNQNQVNESIESISSTLMSMEQCMQRFITHFGGNMTSRNDVPSTGEHTPNVPSNGGIESSTRNVMHGEKVVWVEEVINPEATIFEAPQDGNYTLSDIVDGGFIIWPEYRLRYP